MTRLIFASLLALPGLAQASLGPEITRDSVEMRATVYTAWLQPNPDPQVAGACDLSLDDETIALHPVDDASGLQIFACAVPDR